MKNKVNILLSTSAYANTLTGLIPDIYAALDVVSRELVGFIPSAARDVSGERVAKGGQVTFHKVPSMTAGDVTPAIAVPETTDYTIGTDNLTISKVRRADFGFTGEENKDLNTGPGTLTVQQDMIAQAFRTLTNEIETDLSVEAKSNASLAFGTAGTTPFASDIKDAAQVRKLLDDNGAPASDRSLIIDTAAGVNMRGVAQLTKANEAGSIMTLRQGELLDLFGLSVKESAKIQDHTAGTGASATTDATGYAVGTTSITLASAGTGTIVAGDIITFAGDSTKYQVVTGDTNVANGGTIVIAAPGLKKAIAASATAITVVAASARNIAFSKNALQLVTRAPALPPEGDLAIDRQMIVDPRSGLAFEIAVYPGYRKNRYEISLAWGVKATKSEHIVSLLG